VLEGTVIQPSPGLPADAPSGPGQPQPLVFTPIVPSPGTAPARRMARGQLVLRGGAANLAHSAGRWAQGAGTLGRRYPLEATAIVLLGVGGLILPFPLWLIGAALAVMSRFWPPRDKWIALIGPPVIALLGTMVTALIVGGQGNPVEIYTHALSLDVGYLLRAGSVLCAVHLTMQLRRGPRVRLPPWRR
jgi:hypothetical protein